MTSEHSHVSSVSCCSIRTFDSFDNSFDETREQFKKRLEQKQGSRLDRSRSRPGARSSLDMSMDSYRSTMSAGCEKSLVAQFKGAAITNSPERIYSQSGPGPSQAVVEPSTACAGSNSATPPIVLVQSVCQVQPVYQPVGNCALAWPRLPNSMFTCAQMSAVPHIDLQASMQTDLKANESMLPSSRKTRQPQRRQQKMATDNIKKKVSEADWQERIGKRESFVNEFKSRPIYYENQEGLPGHKRPRTPDARRRDLTRTRWNELAGLWRADWREIDRKNKDVAVALLQRHPEKRVHS